MPQGIEELNELEVLDLRWNRIWGDIPESFGEMIGLESLLLSGNEISGEIPWSIGALQNLKRLDFSNNQLWGSIPSSLSELQSLEALGLQHNQLTGSVPQGLTRIGTLRRIMLNNNDLTGTLPSGLGQLSSGVHVRFDNNRSGFGGIVERDSLFFEEADLNEFGLITGRDLLDETTVVIEDEQVAEFVRTLMSALYVQNGFLHFEPTELPQGVTAEQVHRVIDSVNGGLQETGDRIYSIDDMERALELYNGGEVIPVPKLKMEPANEDHYMLNFEATTSSTHSISVAKKTTVYPGIFAARQATVVYPAVLILCPVDRTRADYPHKSTSEPTEITGKANVECDYIEGPPQSITYTATVQLQKVEYFWGIIPYFVPVGRSVTQRQTSSGFVEFSRRQMIAAAPCVTGPYRTKLSMLTRGSVSGNDIQPNPFVLVSPSLWIVC